MKLSQWLLLSSLVFSQLSFSQTYPWTPTYKFVEKAEEDLFEKADIDNVEYSRYSKDPSEIHRENLAAITNFIGEEMDLTYANSTDVKSLSPDDVEDALEVAGENPVVSLYAYSKYDPENQGIGFCFGRAMFTNIHLAMKGVEREHIKKAFVVGEMSTGDGNQWGWHVTTIVQSLEKDENGQVREQWLAVDPIIGYAITLEEWYLEMRNNYSTDKRLRLYIAEAGKLSPRASSKYTEQLKKVEFYNNYFLDMAEWFDQTANEPEGIYSDMNKYKNYEVK